MEPSSAPASGSVADIQARLLLWCTRADSGLARVEFSSEDSRRRVLDRLRPALAQAGIPLHEVTLPTGMDPTRLVRDLIWRLGQLPPGVVSVDGFPTALPDNPSELAAALYVFNFNRERLAKPRQRQIWWMPPHFAEVFLRAVPDLDSWFLVKLQLGEAAGPPAEAPAKRLEPEPDSYAVNPDDARRQAADLVERFERGIKSGIPSTELLEGLLHPALALLRRAGLENEAVAMESRLSAPGAQAEAAKAQEQLEPPLADAESLYRRASKLHDDLRFAEAESLYRQALQRYEERLGPDHPRVAACLNNLGQLLQATNRPADAEPLVRRALAIDERSFGPDHPDVAIGLNNLAQLLQATNRLAEAEPLMRRALAIDERRLGPDHPTVAINLNNLARLLHDTNRLVEAEPLMRRALTIDERSFGPDHPKVAIRLNNLAQLLQVTHRLAEAEPLMRRALAIDERSFGPDHPKVAIRLNNLARLLQVTHRLVEAEPLMRRALAIDERSFGPDHPKVAIRLNNLAQLLKATDRSAEAEPLMRRALAILTASLGPDHPDTQSVRANLDLPGKVVGRASLDGC